MIQGYDGGQKDIFVRGCCLVSFVRSEKFIIISEEGRKREREREFWRDFRRGGAKKGRGERKKGEGRVVRRGRHSEPSLKTVSESGGQLFFLFPLRRTYDFDALTDPDTRCLFCETPVQTKSFLVSHPSGRKLNQNRPLIILSFPLCLFLPVPSLSS